MKRILFLLMIVFVAAACEKDLYDYEAAEEQLKKFVFTEDFEVPVKEGYITTVTYNGEVLYQGNVAVTIQVPKTDVLAGTRASGLEWHFDGAEGAPDGNKFGFTTWKNGLLLFEDMTNGDNDYNDFVCFVKTQFRVDMAYGDKRITNFHLADLEVFPMALGNTLPISLGFEIINTANNTPIDNIILYKDVRANAFGGKTGFINTDASLPKVTDLSSSSFSKNYSLSVIGNMQPDQFTFNYYIVVNGEKRYVADSSKALLMDNNTPYGLFIPLNFDERSTFKYPIEKKSIYEAYPNFGKWVEGENVEPFAGGVPEYLYTK